MVSGASFSLNAAMVSGLTETTKTPLNFSCSRIGRVKLDRPFTRHLALERLADEQPVAAIAMDAEVFPLAEIDPVLGGSQIGVGHPAVGIDYRNLKGHVRHVLLPALDQLGKVPGFALPAQTQVKQDFVQSLDGRERVLGEGLCLEFGGARDFT